MNVKETIVKRPRGRWKVITIDIERLRCGEVTKLVSRACEQGNGTWRSGKDKEFVFSRGNVRFWRTLLCGDTKLVDWLVFLVHWSVRKLVSRRSILFLLGIIWNWINSLYSHVICIRSILIFSRALQIVCSTVQCGSVKTVAVAVTRTVLHIEVELFCKNPSCL